MDEIKEEKDIENISFCICEKFFISKKNKNNKIFTVKDIDQLILFKCCDDKK